MPRITPLRVVSLLPFVWACLLGTWLLLPSPVIPRHQSDATIDSALHLGKTVTVVTEFSKSLRVGNLCSDCEAAILDWRLESDPATDSVLLYVSDRTSSINLTDAVIRGAPYFNKPSDSQDSIPYVSEPIEAYLRGGTPDDLFIMAWFHRADQILFNYEFRHSRFSTRLRLYVPEPGVVQVWKDIPVWEKFSGPSSIHETDRDSALIATFSHIPETSFVGAGLRASTAKIVVSNVQGSLPSRTYPIRALICGPLYIPTFGILILLYVFVFRPLPLLILSVGIMAVVIVSWQRAGRPPFRDWIVDLPLTLLCCRVNARKGRRRGIWGSSGPLPDEENGLLGKSPTTFISPLNTVFKPSRSRPRVFDRR